MKKITKRAIAFLLSALFVLTSVPFTALASDDDYTALQNAISEYESAMDGTVYDNMQAAYDAYVAAKECEYAYTYGSKTDLDIKAAADALSSATDDMVSNKWAPYKGEAKASYADDSEDTEGLYEGNNDNLLYSPQVASVNNAVPAAQSTHEQANEKDGNANTRVTIKVYYPATVMLYDGETTPVMPVVATGQITQSNGASEVKRFVYSLYTSQSSTSNTPDSKFEMKNSSWSCGNGQDDRNLNWVWSMQQTGGYPTVTPYTSTDDVETKVQLSSKSTVVVWWTYYRASLANAIKYNGSDSDFGSNYYTENYLSWRRFTGGDGPTDYMGMYGGTTPVYVVNYKALRTAVSNAVSSVASNINNYDKNKSQVSALLAAVNSATDFDPNESFNNTNAVATNVKTCADTIKEKINAINEAVVSDSDMNDYNALASAISQSKSAYEGNNADGAYTDDSYSAFKTAYEASQAEAAAVAANGFTSASTGSALDAAYKALNKKAEESGKSGDTDYAYDSENGTVTISGAGEMADYESGAESPFGENSEIKEVTIDPSVTHIGSHAFENANELTTITVPASATYGDGAFDGCTKLKTVIVTGGAINDASATNAPWKQNSVKIVKLGTDEHDFSVTAVDDNVFTENKNTAYYVYYNLCDFSDIANNTFGTNPTFYGWVPSTAYDYATKFNYSFVSLGHEHIWDDGVVTPASCTAGGYTTYTCKFCDATKVGNYTSALNHNWDEGTPVPATCTERGYTLHTCTRCNETKKTNYTKALGHLYDGEKTAQYPSGEVRSDTVQYKHTVQCSRCTEAEKAEYCSFKITGTDANTGSLIFTCQVCGGTYLYENGSASGEHMVFYFSSNNELMDTERVTNGSYPAKVPEITVSETGHRYYWTLNDTEVNPAETPISSDTVFKVKDELAQYTVTYKDDKGEIGSEKVDYGATPADIPELPETTENLADEGHKAYVWDTDPSGAVITSDTTFTQQFVLKSHDFEDTIIKNASCVEDGSMSRHCETCGYNVSNEVIPATGKHSFDETVITKVSCTTDGSVKKICSVCGTEEIETVPATGHKWNSGVVTLQPTVEDYGIKTYTCTVCKSTKAERIDKISVKEATPTDAQANAAKVNKKIPKPAGITTVSNSKKKQLIISFNKIKGAQNYRVMYRKQGAKKWTYAWTKGKTTYTLKNLKNKGLYEFMFAAYTKNANGAWERGNYSKTSYRYYYKEAIKKAKPGKKSLTVSWTKDKNATGYQLYYSTNKNMKGAKCVNLKKNKTSYTVKKLKKGKKYYVRVRALKKVKGKTYVGEYSSKKTIKVK